MILILRTTLFWPDDHVLPHYFVNRCKKKTTIILFQTNLLISPTLRGFYSIQRDHTLSSYTSFSHYKKIIIVLFSKPITLILQLSGRCLI